MRKELQNIEGRRIEVFAVVDRFGKKAAFKGPALDTVCLIDLKDRFGNFLADHLWLTVGKQIRALKLKKGDKVKFQARSAVYEKGYKGSRPNRETSVSIDYKLSHPNHFVNLTTGLNQVVSEPDLFNQEIFNSIT